jgi:hypothetical protein
MALIGIGAALSHPQLSGAVIALAPPEASGMASALTVVARQVGFALGVAMLGALTPVGFTIAASLGPSVSPLLLRSAAYWLAFYFCPLLAVGTDYSIGVVLCRARPRCKYFIL